MHPLPFRVYAITDRRAVVDGQTLLSTAEALVDQAPPRSLAILLRDKDLDPSERLEVAHSLRSLTQRRGVYLLVHGDPSLAFRCGADGFHLPDDDCDLEALRKDTAGLLMGVSCHDARGLERAEAGGADFVTLSPVLPSPGKAEPGDELGWKRFEELSVGCTLPVLALGGLGPEDCPFVARHGAWGLAAISSLFGSEHPGASLSAMFSALVQEDCADAP